MALRTKKQSDQKVLVAELKKTHYFAVMETVKTEDGKMFQDDEGALYLRPHPHKLFNDAEGNPVEFVSPMEIHQAILDESLSDPVGFESPGEIVILEKFVYTKGQVVELPEFEKK